MILKSLATLIFSSNAFTAVVVDCSEAYLSPNTKCEQIRCDEKYQSFLGTWSGPMEELVDFGPNPFYRPYQNVISYSAADCLRNFDTGETFIIGRQTDTYPASQGKDAKVENKLLITGKDKDGSPFLRTVNLKTKQQESWQLVHKNDAAVLSIWQNTGERAGRPYTVETIDAKDWNVANPNVEHRRNVTVTLDSGGFKVVLIRGYHTKQPEASCPTSL